MPIDLRLVHEYRLTYFEGIYRACVRRQPIDLASLNQIENGKRPLRQGELDIYVALYGGHHFHKLTAAFGSAHLDRLRERAVEVIDWGCGQATATCILIDFLLRNRIYLDIHRFTLIEPSQLVLDRGVYYLEQMLVGNPDVTTHVRRICKTLDEVAVDEVRSDPGCVKIHLFSNVLDIDVRELKFDLGRLYRLIAGSNSGMNMIVCTSPYHIAAQLNIDRFYDNFRRNHRIDFNVTANAPILGEIYKVVGHRFMQAEITRYERQFTVHL